MDEMTSSGIRSIRVSLRLLSAVRLRLCPLLALPLPSLLLERQVANSLFNCNNALSY